MASASQVVLSLKTDLFHLPVAGVCGKPVLDGERVVRSVDGKDEIGSIPTAAHLRGVHIRVKDDHVQIARGGILVGYHVLAEPEPNS